METMRRDAEARGVPYPLVEELTGLPPRTADLTGWVCGMLTVLRVHSRKIWKNTQGIYWECVCECGNSHVVAGDRLTTGKTQSCGCLITEVSAAKLSPRYRKTGSTPPRYMTPKEVEREHVVCAPMYDRKIGKLLVMDFDHAVQYRMVRKSGPNEGNAYVTTKCYWVCRCRCGKEVIRNTEYLASKHTRHSCGCDNPRGKGNPRGCRARKELLLPKAERARLAMGRRVAKEQRIAERIAAMELRELRESERNAAREHRISERIAAMEVRESERRAAKEQRRAARTAARDARRAESIAAKEQRRAERIAARDIRRAERIAAKEQRRAERVAARDARRAERMAAKEQRRAERIAARDIRRAERKAARAAERKNRQANRSANNYIVGRKQEA